MADAAVPAGVAEGVDAAAAADVAVHTHAFRDVAGNDDEQHDGEPDDDVCNDDGAAAAADVVGVVAQNRWEQCRQRNKSIFPKGQAAFS